jgi:hypothetical protein
MNMDCIYDEFLICTVREADPEDKKFLENYVMSQEAQGKRVYYPARDTNQVDETGGYRICCDNNEGMRKSKDVSVYWTEKSQGSKYDLGMAFQMHRTEGKRIKLVNRSKVEQLVEEQKTKGMKKSFEMVLLTLDDLAK